MHPFFIVLGITILMYSSLFAVLHMLERVKQDKTTPTREMRKP